MLKSSKTVSKKVSFKLTAEPGSEVYVAGTFNDWNPTANRLKDNPDSGHFKATVSIPKGMHEYKFVVNGQWITDPQNEQCVANAAGSFNSMLQV
jgi:1,4-alpha-glucan branching enzyme